MATTTGDDRVTQASVADRAAEIFLWPGNAVCDALKIADPESRMLLRMFVNLSIYAKVAVMVALAFA